MDRLSHRLRAAALAIALGAPLALPLASPASAQAVRGHGDPRAEAFVESEANRVIAILGNRGLSADAKKRTFRAMIDQVADVPKVTDFVLGKYRRSISPAQYAQFATAFREYAYNVYESRLNAYSGQRLEVTGSVQRAPDDVVVASRIVGGGPADKGGQVLWRLLRGSDGRWRAVDVQVAGVWLAITERQDFVSTLDNSGGDVGVLVRQLRSLGNASRPPA